MPSKVKLNLEDLHIKSFATTSRIKGGAMDLKSRDGAPESFSCRVGADCKWQCED